MTTKLLISIILILNAKACDLKLCPSAINIPQQFTLTFAYQLNQSQTVCFEYSSQVNYSSLAVRLDYLPYVCLLASNDIALLKNGNSFKGQVHISKLCNSFAMKVNETVDFNFNYELRPSFNIANLLIYQSMVYVYLPILIIFLLFSCCIEPFIFGTNITQNKQQ